MQEHHWNLSAEKHLLPPPPPVDFSSFSSGLSESTEKGELIGKPKSPHSPD